MSRSFLAFTLALVVVFAGCLDLDRFASQPEEGFSPANDEGSSARSGPSKDKEGTEKEDGSNEGAGENKTVKNEAVRDYRPRVIIGIPDTGINPYHEVFYRPNLTEHPSTYIEGYPEDIPALNLSVGGDDYDAMFQADIEIWRGLEEGQWFWIPQTVFIGVYCDPRQNESYRGEFCILDHGDSIYTNHGTGTASSAVMENPEALIAFTAGGPSITPINYSGIPIDVYSVSWGSIVPFPGHPQVNCSGQQDTTSLIYVTGGGNDPRSTLIDCWKGYPSIISVGGAYAEGNHHQTTAAHQTEIVSYYCRPVAASQTILGLENKCGTSFSGPTVAGALSKTILAIRNHTGYSGGLQGDYVDPMAGVTKHDLRDAMNQTASYDPKPKYNNTGIFPTNSHAPWLQWGWGFYDGWVANETILHFLEQPVDEKPDEVVVYMEALHTAKSVMRQELPLDAWPFKQDDAGSGQDAPGETIPEVWIESGVVYEGTMTGMLPYDGWDFYAFWGEGGDSVEVRAYGLEGIYRIVDEAGRILEGARTTVGSDVIDDRSYSVTLERDGIHYFVYSGFILQKYSFSIGINEPAPNPGYQGQPVPPIPLPIP